ncbi:MAG TPA: zinc ribbon domain-containing protein [Streptosporangiaceae bacterium]|nr:zinc ribbon domain-containing protein [Streptosporangiaceae bacterium]
MTAGPGPESPAAEEATPLPGGAPSPAAEVLPDSPEASGTVTPRAHPQEASGTSRACPSCGWAVGPDDNFCEACRTELAPAVVSGDEPGAARTCPHCQSPDITADGYCESCGYKLPSVRDHIELDLGLVAGVTDRGKRHHRNEDAMALATAQSASGPVVVAVVCDGVSSSLRPDEASLAAAEAAVGVLLAGARTGQDLAEASRDAVAAAQEAVAGLLQPVSGAGSQHSCGAAGSQPSAGTAVPLAKPGKAADPPSATFVSAVMTGQAVTLCWLGDSRAYWLGNGTGPSAERLTRDDSLGEEMVAAGLLSEKDALSLPQAHVITGWVGADHGDTAPHVTTFEPPGPGVLLLCSDGLWNYEPAAGKLAERALPGALHDPLGTATALVSFALDSGGMDNVTVVLAPFPPKAEPDPEEQHNDEPA